MSDSTAETKAKEMVIQMLCNDPATGEALEVASDITHGPDSSYSFEMRNPTTGVRWRHTIKTEEV